MTPRINSVLKNVSFYLFHKKQIRINLIQARSFLKLIIDRKYTIIYNRKKRSTALKISTGIKLIHF